MPAITHTPNPNVNNSAPSFDPKDENSWFFGFMSRADAADLLSSHNQVGAFLVRESTTAKGDLVLSVKENNDKISHYIINRLAPEKGAQVKFKIGDHVFPDIPALLAFYKTNNLDDTPLKYAAISKVTNCLSHKRSFTRDYLADTLGHTSIEPETPQILQRKLPCRAVVIQSRVPNAYDKTALALKEGQIINVTKLNVSGSWEGEIDGRVGHFPFNHVKFIEDPCDIARRTL